MIKKDKGNTIIYLKSDKNIMNINGFFVDLNLVTHIDLTYTDKISLSLINGKNLGWSKPKTTYSMKGVPEAHAYVEYKKEDVLSIINGFTKEFHYYNYSELYDSKTRNYFQTYRIYNRHETEKINKLADIEWFNLRNKVLKKWSGVGKLEGFTIMNNNIVSLIKEYYELNKGDDAVLRDIERTFGFSYGDILDNMDIDGDWYVGNDGEIVKL